MKNKYKGLISIFVIFGLLSVYLVFAQVTPSLNLNGFGRFKIWNYTEINSSGNVTALDSIKGNGSTLSDINIAIQNKNVTLNNLTINNLYSNGNITASYLFGNVSLASGLPTGDSLWGNNSGNVYVNSTISAWNISGNNITASEYIFGNVSLASGLPTGDSLWGNNSGLIYIESNISVQNISAINITAEHFIVKWGGGILFENPNGSSVCIYLNSSLQLVINNNVTGITCP